MSQKYQLGFFARIMRNVREKRKIRELQKKELFVGEDEHGNKYFERPQGLYFIV